MSVPGVFFGVILLVWAWPPQARATACDPTQPGCVVYPIIQNRCATCHDEIQDEFGRLDLSRWLRDASGRPDFPNQDGHGNQLAQKLTLEDIWSRAATDDPDLRMPLGDQLSDDDLKTLRSWIDELEAGS